MFYKNNNNNNVLLTIRLSLLILLLIPILSRADTATTSKKIDSAHAIFWSKLTIQEQHYLKTHPVLRVQSEANYPPYNFINQGKPAGHSIDYLKVLARIMAVKFQFVTGFSWEEYLDKLKNNELDLMVNIVATPERAKFAKFSIPISKTFNALTVKKDNINKFKTLDDFNGQKIAVIKQYYQEDLLQQYYPNIHLVLVNSVIEGLTSVANGSADAFIAGIGVSNYFITQYYLSNLVPTVITNNPHFPIINTGIATNKHNPILSSIINKAIAMMPEADMLKLSRKWFNNNNSIVDTSLHLTQPELYYLRQHPIIKVQNELDFPPFNYMVDGKPTGYSIDYINLIAKKLDIKVQFEQHKSWNEYLAMLQHGELDAMVNITATNSRQKFARFTTPYINSSNAMAVRKGEFSGDIDLASLNNKRIAVIKGYATSDQIRQLLPNANIIDFPNIPAALNAVANRNADMFFGVRAVANYYINKNFLTNLTLTTIAGEQLFQTTAIGIAVRKDHQMLLGLLQKAINAIPEPELIQLRQRWMNVNDQHISSVTLTAEEQNYLNHKRLWKININKNFPPFSFVSQNMRQGFSIDLIKLVAKMLNVRLEFIPGIWTDQLKMIQNHKLDVLLDVANTQARRKIMRFTQPYLDTRDVIVIRANKPQIESSLSSFNGHTFACVKDYAITNLIKTHFPNIHLLYVESTEQALTAVSEGRADGMVANEVSANYLIQKNFITNLQTIPVVEAEALGKATLSMAVAYNNRLLLSIINKALLSVPEQQLIKLRNKWFGQLNKTFNTQATTTKQQKEWLITHDTQTLYLPELGLPLIHKTPTGEQGIIPDFINYFKLQLAIDWTDVDNIKNSKNNQLADIIIADPHNANLQKNFLLSKPITSMPIVAITGNSALTYVDDLSKLTSKLTGVLKNASYKALIHQRYPNLQLIEYKTISSAIMAASRGDIQLLLCPLAQCSYTMNELGLSNLRIINQTKINDTLHFAVRKDWPELVAILNQILMNMSPQLKNSIYRRWNSREDVLIKTDYSLIWYLLSIAIAVISVVVAWNRRIARYAQKIEAAHNELKNTQQQLVQSEKMASLGTLTAGVAHEINNPTNFTYASIYLMKNEIEAIKQFLKQLAGGEQADPLVLQSFDEKFSKLTELANTAAEGTQRIKIIVNNLRTFTRLDNAEHKRVFITELITSTINLVQTQFNNIDIRTEFLANPSLNCYPAKLAQVFMNLIVNACQAIEAHKAHQTELQGLVTITTELLNSQLHISFQDNGCGMDKITQQRIFEPFFTTKDVGSGTGLGMAISFSIIEEHHGMIKIHSQLNQDTTITVVLPILQSIH